MRLAREIALEAKSGLPRRARMSTLSIEVRPGEFPSERIAAAETLLWLARDSASVDSLVLESIEDLSRDPSPAVRYTVARRASLVVTVDPERVWRASEDRVRREDSSEVQKALLHTLSVLVNLDIDRAADLIALMYEREELGQAREGLLIESAGVLLDLWVWRAHPSGQALLDRMVKPLGSR